MVHNALPTITREEGNTPSGSCSDWSGVLDLENDLLLLKELRDITNHTLQDGNPLPTVQTQCSISCMGRLGLRWGSLIRGIRLRSSVLCRGWEGEMVEECNDYGSKEKGEGRNKMGCDG